MTAPYITVRRICRCGGDEESHQRTYTNDGSRIACFHEAFRLSLARFGAIEPVCECRAFVFVGTREVGETAKEDAA